MSLTICDKPFIDNKYSDIFLKYPFKLSDFQKWAIKGITEDKSILITACTGSGKTLPAEYAIEHFIKNGKKVIYTCPVKALSNEKNNSLIKKYPDISFGILTGDVKFNPEADVLIMTTEILRNTLFQLKLLENNNDIDRGLLHFDMDIRNELGAVIFDEIHYINDKDRGTVWEESIMMLPNYITIIGLSATIDKPEHFCKWIINNNKDMYLCPNKERIVPLYHNMFMTFPISTPGKYTNDKLTMLDNVYEKPKLIKNKHEFIDKIYYEQLNVLKSLSDKNIRVKPSYILNRAIYHLNKIDALPAIIFVFSKKKIHEYANSISVCLYDEDCKTPSIIRKKCEQILISKIDNYKEYLLLPEFNEIINLLEKGIAIHHSGIISIFREMIEILFAEKLIKVLFATETFAVGINMPAKTVVFTSLTKYSNNGFRLLLPNEYTQMAGRAGRRGIDDKGLVYHLVNLYYDNRYGHLPNKDDLKHMLSNKSPILKSKFNIHYNIILRLISYGCQNFNDFMNKSMQMLDINDEINNYKSTINLLEIKYEKYNNQFNLLSKTNYDDMKKCKELMFKINHTRNKQRKKYEKELNRYKNLDFNFDNNLELFNKIYDTKLEINKHNKYINNLINNNDNIINKIINYMIKYEFIIKKDNDDLLLTDKGLISSNIQEYHSLAMADIIHSGILNDITPIQLTSILSIFTNIKLSDNNRIHNINYLECDSVIKNIIYKIKHTYDKYYDMETEAQTNFIEDYYIHYDMVDFINKWCLCNTQQECLSIYNEAKQYDIYVGDFVKSILKINNIVNELEKICKLTNNYKLMEIINKIPNITLKNIATNQSLYL